VVLSGANVLICQKGIDDIAQHFLAKANILALRRVKKSDIERLAKATGARIISNLDDIARQDLGAAGVVEELKVGDEPMTYVRECKHPRAVTLLARGGTGHVIAEVERAMEDAIGVVTAALQSGKVVAGAGAPEMELARQLRSYANALAGREQLAVQAFADAMEVIPRTLAENAGIDPIDAMTELKAAHGKGEKWAGINVFTGKKMDAWKQGILEPLKIKTQAVSSAAEVAVMILRIDDVISGERTERPAQKGPGAGPEADE
jgi:chaperonin GroEL (HSP60 family)